MKHNRCEICAFSSLEKVSLTSEVTRCRRHAPLVSAGSGFDLTVWPVVNPSDWCGEFLDKSADRSF